MGLLHALRDNELHALRHIAQYFKDMLLLFLCELPEHMFGQVCLGVFRPADSDADAGKLEMCIRDRMGSIQNTAQTLDSIGGIPLGNPL